MSPPDDTVAPTIASAKQWVQNAQHLLFFVGAGLSKASGIQTFRDGDGWYQDRRVEELANITSFSSQRSVMLSWYQQRRLQAQNVQPNEGHLAIAACAKNKKVTVATQNVDDLLERAQMEVGTSCPVWHVHGSLAEVRCHHCARSFVDLSFDLSTLPVCEACDGPLRPGVVWFGESLPEEPLLQSFRAADACDVCILVGTSGVVYPAALIPERAAAAGAKLVEVNPNASALSSLCHASLRGPAHELLPDLLSA